MKRFCIIIVFSIIFLSLLSQVPENIFRDDERLAEQYVDDWIDESWTDDEHHDYVYNSESQLIEYTILEYIDNEWQNYERRTYAYNTEGFLAEMIWQISLEENWVNYYRYTYSYNENDLQSYYILYMWEEENWLEYSRYEYVYDDDQVPTKRYRHTWSYPEWVLYDVIWYTYYNNGLVVEALHQTWSSGGGYWINYGRSEKTYNSHGDLISLRAWDSMFYEWELMLIYDYEYEYIDDIKQSMIFLFHNGYWSKEQYFYNSNGNLCETICQDWISDTWVNDERTTSIYESTDIQEHEIIKIENKISVYPNPFNPETTINFTINDPGQYRFQIFNIKGEKVSTILDSYLTNGDHSIKWFGKNDKGKHVSSGIYFGKLLNNNQALSTIKMVLLK